MADGIQIRQLTWAEFAPHFTAHRDTVFAGDHSYPLTVALDETARAKLTALDGHMSDVLDLNLGAFDAEGRFVGWAFGIQESRGRFYMINSAVLPEHRRRGIYSALLTRTLEEAAERGFQVVTSRHAATNNAVIIPKLKAGFVIAGMELDDVFGTLVHLRYDLNPLRREVLRYRAGDLAPDARVQVLFDGGPG